MNDIKVTKEANLNKNYLKMSTCFRAERNLITLSWVNSGVDEGKITDSQPLISTFALFHPLQVFIICM